MMSDSSKKSASTSQMMAKFIGNFRYYFGIWIIFQVQAQGKELLY